MDAEAVQGPTASGSGQHRAPTPPADELLTPGVRRSSSVISLDSVSLMLPHFRKTRTSSQFCQPPRPLNRRRIEEVSSPPPTALSVDAWVNIIENYLTSIAVHIEGPTVEAIVPALFAHIGALFGGPPMSMSSNVHITGSTSPKALGLLTTRRTWNVCVVNPISDTSRTHIYIFRGAFTVGTGVERTVITELVKRLWADMDIWKIDGSGHHVISVRPQGVPSNSDRIRQLKIYGYICMLHMIVFRAIPAQLSPMVLAAVIIGESALLDREFIRALDFRSYETLSAWPTHASLLNTRDLNLQTLVCEHLNLQVDHGSSHSQFHTHFTNLSRPN